MKTIFQNYREMLAECDQLINDDVLDAEDRDTIQSFYNGRDTMDEDEAKEQGKTNVVNHLLGYDSISTAARQIESIYTKGSIMWSIELSNMPKDKEHLRGKWEACIRDALNGAIKDSRRMKPEWKALAGEITLFGNSTLYFKDRYDWCPNVARPYVPRGTGILPDELTHFMIADYMTLNDLKVAKQCAEKRKTMGHESCWNITNLNTLIKTLEGSLQEGNAASPIIASHNQPLDEVAEDREINSSSSTTIRTRVPVYYFYHRNDKDNGKSFDLVILPRLTPQVQETVGKSSAPFPDALYDHPSYFDHVRHALHPFFVDCQIGGKSKWHRVMGLGRLNYEADVEIEENFNEMMTGARDNMRRLYAVKTAADWELLSSWASGEGPTNVLPPGVEVADVSRQPNFQHAMVPLQMLMQLTRKNAASSTVQGINGGGQEGELEINALERQGRNAEALAGRMSDLYEHADALGHEILRRFLSTDALPTDPGWDEINAFQTRLREEEISVHFLAQMRNGGFKNLCVKTSRAAGDGNTMKQAMANAALIQRLPMFSAEAQQIILRRITAEDTGDYEFAEQVVPYEPSKDTNQIIVSAQENDQCDKMGIINYVPELKKDDLDLIHIEEHMRSMQADIARGKVRPWDQVDLAAFMAKGSHTALHIQKIAANKSQKQMATSLTQQLQKLAKEGQEFQNNMNKQNEAAKQPLTQKDQATLQLQSAQLQLKNRQQDALEDHRAKVLQLSREKAALTGDLQTRGAILSEEGQAHDQMMDRTDRTLQAQDRAAAAEERAMERSQGNAEAQQPVAANEPA